MSDPIAAEPRHVFVYGTLRPALATGEPRLLIEPLQPVGPATVQGLLYDLGDYPGLVAGAGTVHGDLLAIATAGQLAALDAYEECGPPAALFCREQAAARRPDGTSLAVWVYRYCRPVDQAKPIPAGDYAGYLRSRSRPWEHS